MSRVLQAFMTLTILSALAPLAVAANAKYLVVGTNAGPATDGRIFELNGSGTAVVGAGFALPAGPPNSSFPVFNSGNGLLMYGGSRPGTVGNFDLETWIDTSSATVATHAYGLGGLVDSEWAADSTSGNFLSAVRSLNRVVTYNPVAGTFTSGATHTMGIPESTWIYDGHVWSTEEGSAIWRTPLLAGGTTSGAMTNMFSRSPIPNSQGGYSEYATAVTFDDGITLYGDHSKNLYLFDLDAMPSAPVTTIDLFSVLTTSAGGFTAVDGYVTGIVLDPSTDLFYATGVFRNAGAAQSRDFLIAVSKGGVVTPLLQEINGDVIVTGTGYGLAFADFSSANMVPEPQSFALGLFALAAVGLLAWRRRR